MLNFLLVSGRISFKCSGIVTFLKYFLITGKKNTQISSSYELLPFK